MRLFEESKNGHKKQGWTFKKEGVGGKKWADGKMRNSPCQIFIYFFKKRGILKGCFKAFKRVLL